MLTNYALPAALSVGQFVLSGRTGGSWQEQDVDNLTIITVPATNPVVGPVSASVNSWTFKIYDSGSTTPNTNSITVTVDGQAVTPTSITQSGSLGSGDGTGITTVSYRSGTRLFSPNTLHTNVVQFTGTGFSGSVTQALPFSVPRVTGTLDRVGGYVGTFKGLASYSTNGSGHTGLPGDYAVDTHGGNSANCVLANETVLATALQAAAYPGDVMSVSFWEKRRTIGPGAISMYWIFAANESQGRGWQLHCPYPDERMFFDTGGTAAPAQRFQPANMSPTSFPGFTDASWWNSWHHIVAIKNGGAKQWWIDGYLYASQASGASPLRNDFNAIYMGSGANVSKAVQGSIDGLIDDFAIYSTALSGTDVTNLFNGTPPNLISAASSLVAWWDFNDFPTVSVAQMGTKAVVTFSQVLQSSTNVSGPYVDLPTATSPYTNDMTVNPTMFFRTHK